MVGLALFALAAVAAPQRIVSTAPSITETLYALGLGNRVVGVTTYCNYPAEARTKPKIGTYIEPNFERIASLKPDLVVIQKNPINMAARLGALKLNVVEVSHDTVEDVFVSIARIASAAGVPDNGRALVARMRGQLENIRARTAKLPARRMMFVVGRAPDAIEDVIAVGRASYLNGIIELAGGANIFRDAVAPYPKIGLEDVLARNPEVIVDMGDMSDTSAVTAGHKAAVVKLWSRYGTLTAVRNQQVFAVAADVFTVPGPRMPEAALAFARMLHPEAGL